MIWIIKNLLYLKTHYLLYEINTTLNFVEINFVQIYKRYTFTSNFFHEKSFVHIQIN